MRKKIFLIGLIILLPLNFIAQQANSALATIEKITENVKSAPCQMKDRLEAVRKLFIQQGAKEDELTVENFDQSSNVVVTKKGKTAETVIIGAHYDKTDLGCGAIDNWTGVSIIGSLFGTLRQFQTEKTYIFVAFDKEEKGLLGSESMAKSIPKEVRKNYCWMINVDSFGKSAPQAMTNVSSSKMTKAAKKLANETNFPFAEAGIFNANADSHSFINKGIPSITFHGLDGNWQKYLHNKEDKFENINMESVYLGYRFIFNFIAKLDSEDCQGFR